MPAKTEEVSLCRGRNVLLVHFPACGRTHFILHTGSPFYQTTPLAMQWYRNSSVLPFDAVPEWKGKDCWMRFVSPPGLESMEIDCTGTVEAFCEGVPMHRKGKTFIPLHKSLRPAQIALRIRQTRGCYAGGAVLSPITFVCGEGIISIGDWSQIDGLRCYSGGILYSKNFLLPHIGAPVVLDLGEVASSAVVWVNGRKTATLCAPPFRADVSRYVHMGENRVEVLVHNTLANQMSTMPTIYQGSLTSGILG